MISDVFIGDIDIDVSLADKKRDQRFHSLFIATLSESHFSPVCFSVGAGAETQALWFVDASVYEGLF